MRNGFFLKSRVSEIHVNQIRVNQGVGVYKKFFEIKVFYLSCRPFFFTCTEKIQFLDMILNATLFLENNCFQHES